MTKRVITVCLAIGSVVLGICNLQVLFPLGWPRVPAVVETPPIEAMSPDQPLVRDKRSGVLQIQGDVLQTASGGLLSVELHALQVAAQSQEPLAIALLLDTSGSMKGERKLSDALDAISELLERLEPTDRLALITYANDATVTLELERRKELGLARSMLAGIRAGGATNISDALALGEKVLQGVQGPKRLLLVSDGLPNRGETDFLQLAKRTESLRQSDIVLSTLGLGLNFNEDLLSTLANAGNGDYTYCKDGTTMAEAMGRELLRARGLAAQNVTVEIQLPEGVRPEHFYGRTLDLEGQRLFYRLGDLASGERRDLLVKLSSAAAPVQIRVRHDNLMQTGLLSRSTVGELNLTKVSGRLEQDAVALAKVELGLVCASVPQSLALATGGNRDEAGQLLQGRIDGLRRQTPEVEPVFESMATALQQFQHDLLRIDFEGPDLRDLEIRAKLLTRNCR